MAQFFKDCEIIKRSELEVKGGIKLPFLFHVKDFVDYGEDLDDMTHEYRNEYIKEQMMRDMFNMLDYVDLTKLQFDNDLSEIGVNTELNYTDDGNKIYILKSTKELYKLLNHIGLTENDFNEIKYFVIMSRTHMIIEFRDMVVSALLVGEKSEKLTEAFMTLHKPIEAGGGIPLFRENIGKAYCDYSEREMFVTRMYWSRKYEVDNFRMEKSKQESAKKNNK